MASKFNPTATGIRAAEMNEDGSAVIIEKDTYKWRQGRSEHRQGRVTIENEILNSARKREKHQKKMVM